MEIIKYSKDYVYDRAVLVSGSYEYPIGISEKADKTFSLITENYEKFIENFYFSQRIKAYENCDMPRKRIRFEKENVFQKVGIYESERGISVFFSVSYGGIGRRFSFNYFDSELCPDSKFAEKLFKNAIIDEKISIKRNKGIYLSGKGIVFYDKA